MSLPYLSSHPGTDMDDGINKARWSFPLWSLTELTGGGIGKLDGIDVSGLETGTTVKVIIGGAVSVYQLQETTAVESPPGLILPDQEESGQRGWVRLLVLDPSSWTPLRALQVDVDGNLESSNVTVSELAYLSGVTSGLQTQLDNRLPLSGGTLTGALTVQGILDAVLSDAGTNDVQVVEKTRRTSTGTPAAGFGARHLFQLKSSTTADQDAAAISAVWEDATHATRSAGLALATVNQASAITERWRLRPDGRLTAIDTGAFLESYLTVNQSTYPSISGGQVAQTLQDGSAYSGTDATMSTKYIGVRFTASAAHTMGDFCMRVKRSGTISNTWIPLTGYIYADDGGAPSKPTGAALATGQAVLFGTLTTSYAVFSFGTQRNLTLDTVYWLVLAYSSVPTGGGSIVLDSGVSANQGATSPDGTAWTNTSVQLYYSIRGLTTDGIQGFSTNGNGARGSSVNSYGGYFSSTNSYGGYFSSTNSYGGYFSSVNSTAIYGISPNWYAGYFSSTNSLALYGISVHEIAILGVSTNNTAIYGTSTNGLGISANSVGNVALLAGISPASTNTIAETIRVRRQTSGTAANGIGGSLDFYIEDNAGQDELSGRLAFLLTNTASGSETSAFTVSTRTGGAAIAETFRIGGGGEIAVPTTITPPGTTGNQTIHKVAGRVNFAAAATTLTVTNNLVTANSIVLAQAATNDATGYVKNVVPGAGSFVINLVAAATAEIAVSFLVIT